MATPLERAAVAGTEGHEMVETQEGLPVRFGLAGFVVAQACSPRCP
jgi:hypothetical protein